MRRPSHASLAGLLVSAGVFAPQGVALGFGEPRAKINVIDVQRAPEMWVFTTLLDAKDRPVPPGKVTGIELWMNGRKVSATPVAPPLKETDQGVALALVACGTNQCQNLKKVQSKGMGALGSLARPIDVGTVWVYENNVVNLNDGKWVGLQEATGGMAKARVSATAYKSKWLAGVQGAVNMFGAHTKKLPANRLVVVLSDGLDGRDPTGRGSDAAIKQIVDAAKKWNVRVMTVGYSSDTDIGMANLRLLSRKTGGTFRRAYRPSEIPILLKEVAAEIFYQHSIFAVPPVKDKRKYGFYVAMLHKNKRVVTPRKPAYEVFVKETFFRWAYWGRIALIVGVILLVILLIVVGVLWWKKRKKRKAEIDKAYKRAAGEEVDDDDVEDELEDVVDELDDDVTDAAQDAADDAPKGKLCSTCGRVMLADWTECLFCARGIAGSGQ